MKIRIKISELSKYIGQTVQVFGWVQTIRQQKHTSFLILRDISGLTQIVVESDKLGDLTLESVICVEGKVVEAKVTLGGIEIQAEKIEILSPALPELPIPVVEKDAPTDQSKRLDWRWIDLRKQKNTLVFKVWTTMEQAFRNYCIDNGFIEIHSPKLIESASESGAELFELKYFDRKAYLAQSPQLYKQMAMAAGFEKVFEVGPVFRANPSFTSRHDTEFTMYDIELSFIKSHHDLMDEEEKMIQKMFLAIKNKHDDDVQKHYGQNVIVPTIPFPRLSLMEAKKILKDLGVPNERGDDMSPEEERAIAKYVKDKFDHDFVFIFDFPSKVRAFYSMRHEDRNFCKSFDLLYRGLEITSGAQREHRPKELKRQIVEQGLSEEEFKNYINFFKYGCPPHGGFAPGPTRILMQLLGVDNVREVTYLYRGVNRLSP